MLRKSLALPAALCSLAACGSSKSPDAPQNIDIRTAPLNLPGIDFACYDVLVENGAATPETVIARGTVGQSLVDGDTTTLCSTRFGNGPGGDISYVAPCDAQLPGHTVTLWVDGVYTGTPEAPVMIEYQDPCPAGCALPVTCVENADTPVTFNLTIMRPANQGFFDIGVNFDDIFCSAKVDCETAGGLPLNLLHHPVSKERGQTVVLALACSAGPGATDDTVLFRDPIVVTCAGMDPIVLDPTLGEGNVFGPVIADPDLADPVWQYATYFGDEALDCGGMSCNKRYWNVAVGFDATAADCTITTSATGAASGTMNDHMTPAASTYPWIGVDVQLTGALGGLACTTHPLNDTPVGVSTSYTDIEAQKLFCHRYDGAMASVCSVPTATIVGALTTEDPGQWSDSTIAATCNDYLNPGQGYAYSGSTGDGVYLIDPDGAGGTDAFPAYCDMTNFGGGWTRLEGASYPFVFTDANWESVNFGSPLAPNYSALGQRFAFVDGGCYTMRFSAGRFDTDPLGVGTGNAVWQQCHDAFTESTTGDDYTFIDGSQSSTCGDGGSGLFEGLHNTFLGYSRTTDVDSTDGIGCWRWQVVPTTLYTGEGTTGVYLDAFPHSSSIHEWQSLWYR